MKEKANQIHRAQIKCPTCEAKVTKTPLLQEQGEGSDSRAPRQRYYRGSAQERNGSTCSAEKRKEKKRGKIIKRK